MNIIHAHFMHQHKDNAVYEREILLGTPTLNQYYGKQTTYLEFDLLILAKCEPEFVKRWYKDYRENCRNTHVTRRSLRFVDSDGAILYELSKRPLKARICIPQLTDISHEFDIPSVHICCVINENEVRELAKILHK